jgi:ribonuclease BN (tRNA processing enzyme)
LLKNSEHVNKNSNSLYNSYENERILNVFINATHASHITGFPDNPQSLNFPGKT